MFPQCRFYAKISIKHVHSAYINIANANNKHGKVKTQYQALISHFYIFIFNIIT